MQIISTGSAPVSPGPSDYFTGSVTIAARFQREEPARIGGVLVSFGPGARTAWHTHPVGQTLFVTAGRGLVQVAGEAPRQIVQGDIVWFSPGQKHWHGAAPDTAMTHLALAEQEGGQSVVWLEKVEDDAYRDAAAKAGG